MDIEELIDNLVNAASNRTSAHEWGTGIAVAARELGEARQEMRNEIARLQAHISTLERIIQSAVDNSGRVGDSAKPKMKEGWKNGKDNSF